MTEFLENSNSYHLGIKQDGEPLGDVGLPPWAKVIHYFVYVSVSILLKNTDGMQLALVHGAIRCWTLLLLYSYCASLVVMS